MKTENLEIISSTRGAETFSFLQKTQFKNIYILWYLKIPFEILLDGCMSCSI